jgi:flagellar protein FliO/FliZ
MMNLIMALFSMKVMAADMNQLNSIKFEEIGQTPALTFEFEAPVTIDNIEARFIRRTVEWDLSSTKLKKDKLFVNVSKFDINNVYVSHNDDKSVRVRVNMDNGKMASNYHERIQYSIDGKKLLLKLDPNIPLITNNIKEINRVYSLKGVEAVPETDQKSEEHIAAVSTIKVDASESIALDTNAPENEIPLKPTKATATVSGMPSLKRIAAGFFVIGLLVVSAIVMTRKMKSKQAGKAFSADSITVVSQKYLGPKRNLVLVRVTGEYLLLGVTDHNISLIKNLNVVDDEIPELMGNKNFKEELRKKEEPNTMYAEASDVEDSFSVSSLDDVKKIFKKKRYVDEVDF